VILPLGDSPNPRGVPVVTYALLLANVAVYVFVTIPLSLAPVDPGDPLFHEYARVIARSVHQRIALDALLSRTSAYDLFVFQYGFRPAAPHVAALFCSLFLHAGLLHLAGNMLFLWIYGDNVEHRLGRVWYLVAYLGTGVAATLFHSVFDSASELPLVGASGAISGVLGFYCLWFPHNRVRLLVVFFPFLIDVITVPARLVLSLFLIVDNLLPFLAARGTESGGVAYGAHLGGFLVGGAIAWLMDRRALVVQPAQYRRTDTVDAAVDTPATTIRGAIDAGRFAAAARIYFALEPAATRRLLAPEQSLALADWLHGTGSNEAALAVYRRHLRDYPNGPGAAEAHLGAGLVLLGFGQATPAYQHFLEALDLDPLPETAAQLRAAIDVVAARQKFQLGPFQRGGQRRDR
jgi:membrane associated rhomboid family serine protease